MIEQIQSNQKTDTHDEYQQIIQDYIKNTFTDHLGMELLKYEPGYAYTRIKIKSEFINPFGGLHGGIMFTIADNTGGIASVHPGNKETMTTVDSHIQFLRPALNLDYLYAEAKIVKDGKRMVFTDVFLLTEDGIALAKASFTFARIHIPGVVHRGADSKEIISDSER